MNGMHGDHCPLPFGHFPPPKTWEHVFFVYIMFSVFVNKLTDRNKVFKL